MLLLLQANIGGFQGRPSTLIGALDTDNGAIYLKKADKAVIERIKDASIITNIPMNEYEYFFDEAIFKDAIKSFNVFNAKNAIFYSGGMERVRPSIQLDKITENGVTYSLYPDIPNEQICTIAICYLAEKLLTYQNVINFQEDLLSI